MVAKVHSPTESWDQMKSQWRAGTKSRHRPTPSGVPGTAASGDSHYANENEYLRIMEVIRWYERNDPVVQAALTRLTTNVCQRGFTLDPQTGDEEVDQRLHKEWLEWSTDPSKCCARGRLTFNEIAALGFRSTVRDGDCHVLPLKSGRLRMYEAHRCRTPRNTTKNVVHGVLLDGYRRPIQYWYTNEEIAPHSVFDRVSDSVKIDAFDNLGNPQVFHLARPHRDSQVRGVSWMAPSIDALEMGSNINFAKMVQQQVVSSYAMINKRSKDFNPADVGADRAGKTRDQYLQEFERQLGDIGPGMLYDTLPGEELVMSSPNVPDAGYFEHANLLLTFFAMNIDLPKSVLLLDPSDTNFSGWRGAIDQARQSWRVMQQWLINQLCVPTYKWWVRRKLATENWLQDAMAGGVDIFKHEWKPPAWPYIEPHKDAIADQAIIQSGMSTRRRRMADRGISYDDEMPTVFGEIKNEIAQCMEIAASLNKQFAGQIIGQPIDWREPAQARGIIPAQTLATLSGMLGEENQNKKVAAA